MTANLEKTYEEVKGLLSKKLKGPSYQTWIKPTKLTELNGSTAVITVKNDFNKNFLIQCYKDVIIKAFEKVLKKTITLEIKVDKDLDIGEFVSSIASLQESTPEKQNEQGYFDHTFRYKNSLNASYNFENFVVGTNNQFCHAAALAIAEFSDQNYNPFFIYSGVGLGKTHLVNAIGNYVLDQNQNKRVKYLSSEEFTNELIRSIRTDNMNSFREKYRNVDVLMIDDIQFLEGKEATQEEFFHTFNTLREAGKQVILTSDRPPSSLSSITDRLKSRFEGGLIADIQSPNLETRMAILMLKAIDLNIQLEETVAEYIASIYSSNVRELEGALKRVHAYLSFTGEDLDLKNVQRVLGKEITKKTSPNQVLKAISSYFNINIEDLISTKRSSDLTLPRHLAIYLLHDVYKLSFPRIGELFSNRTHSSAIYAYQKVKKRIEKEEEIRDQVNSLRRVLEKRS